jgi:hypothetical protein
MGLLQLLSSGKPVAAEKSGHGLPAAVKTNWNKNQLLPR